MVVLETKGIFRELAKYIIAVYNTPGEELVISIDSSIDTATMHYICQCVADALDVRIHMRSVEKCLTLTKGKEAVIATDVYGQSWEVKRGEVVPCDNDDLDEPWSQRDIS